MKNELIKSFVEGFKDSFKLAGCLFLAVASTIAAFANHDLSTPNDHKKDGHQSTQS